jgi:hypothetical protein
VAEEGAARAVALEAVAPPRPAAQPVGLRLGLRALQVPQTQAPRELAPRQSAAYLTVNNSVNDTSGAGNSAKVPTVPGTSNLGTAQSAGSTNSGSGEAGSTTTAGVARNQAGVSGSRIDGTVQKGPAMQGDAEISAESAQVDKKVKSICKGC